MSELAELKQEKIIKTIYIVCAIAAATAATQWAFLQKPAAIGLADMLMGVAFLGVLIHAWLTGSRLRYPLLLGFAVALYGLAALLSRAGISGALETVQRVAQLYCGFMVFGLLWRDRPRWLVSAVGAGLVLNLAAAIIQVGADDFSAATGFFTSRMIFSYYLAIVIVWLQPLLLARYKNWLGSLGLLLLTTVVLLMMTNGQMLVLACLSLLLLGFLLSRRCLLINCTAILLLLLSLGAGTDVRNNTLLSTLSPFDRGMPKQAHTEVIAAVRMAADKPWTGVGPGHYQDHIGMYYRELPNPNVNTIARDTQSGIGILAGTAGFPTAVAFLLVLLGMAATALKSFYSSSERYPVLISGAAALGVLLAGMLISDPFVRGLGWFIGLAGASVFVPEVLREKGIFVVRALALRSVIGWGAAFAVLVVGIVAISGVGGTIQWQPVRAAAPAVERESRGASGLQSANLLQAGTDVFRIINAKEAVRVEAPALLQEDSSAAMRTSLVIPEGAGTPPEGEEPDLKYGGAEFEIEMPAAAEAKVWLRTLWGGSCSNSVNVRTDTMERAFTVGNDGTYDVWHWLEAPVIFTFSEGKNSILILNREDGIRLDQILITTDLHYVPQGIESE